MQQSTNAVPVAMNFARLYRVWRRTRRGKKPGMSQLRFEYRWLDSISHLAVLLRQGRWFPRRAVCFHVQRPKVREIHAPDFADRLVHTWLVDQLEPLFDRRFIEDSFANRRGKGTHGAIRRLQPMIRRVVDGPGKGQGYYLQLDIRNYFYSIHRPTLYRLLKQRLQSLQDNEPQNAQHYRALQSLCHKLLARPQQSVVINQPSHVLPKHKQLRHAAPRCGLPIGNLSSQFFANVYLNELDQFVKHRLKVRYYIRYVDDFVLLHADPKQLEQWHNAIAKFLQLRLQLRLKPASVRCVGSGIDFLGYRVYAHDITIRARVIKHLRERLHQWQRRTLRQLPHGVWLHANKHRLQTLQQVCSSYLAHCRHARHRGVLAMVLQDFPWLTQVFASQPWLQARAVARWQQGAALGLQDFLRRLAEDYPEYWLVARCGYRYWLWVPSGAAPMLETTNAHPCLWRDISPASWRLLRRQLCHEGMGWLQLEECRYLRGGGRERYVSHWFIPYSDYQTPFLEDPNDPQRR